MPRAPSHPALPASLHPLTPRAQTPQPTTQAAAFFAPRFAQEALGQMAANSLEWARLQEEGLTLPELD